VVVELVAAVVARVEDDLKRHILAVSEVGELAQHRSVRLVRHGAEPRHRP
jgi:Cdc6-like AAA superfamily ATPase